MSKSIVEIQGYDELVKKIKNLPVKAKRSEVLKILRRSARSTVKEAQNQAPVSKRPHKIRGKEIRPGNLKKSIGVQTARRSKNPMVVVRPRSTKAYDGFYGRAFVIFGHNVYRKGFKRNRRGNRLKNAKGAKRVVRANPFMNRAYQRTEGKVSNDALASTEKYIQKLIDRL